MAADLILGIDPGKDGALALIEAHSGQITDLYDMPVLQLKSKRELDGYRLASMIDNHAHEIAEVWLERVWSLAGEGVNSAFAFGEVYGLVKGVCMASFLPLHEVQASIWKRAMGVKGDKDEGRKAASILYPAACDRWPLIKHHGRADAVLIAAYGRRQVHREAA